MFEFIFVKEINCWVVILDMTIKRGNFNFHVKYQIYEIYHNQYI